MLDCLAGLGAAMNQRQKSRPSTQVAFFQSTPTAERKRNCRRRSIPYERRVVDDLPQATSSAK